jgi:hypothetical protein
VRSTDPNQGHQLSLHQGNEGNLRPGGRGREWIEGGALHRRVEVGARFRSGQRGGPDPPPERRYFDTTPQAEYLYDRVIDTVRRDLREEVLFVEVFDRAVNAVMDRIDMPNRKAAQLVKLVMQNGRIGADKRARLFPELTEAEIDALETIVRAAGTPSAGPIQASVSPAVPLQPSPR